MIKRLAIRLGLWIARLGGWKEQLPCTKPHECTKPHLPTSAMLVEARKFIDHVEAHLGSTDGAFKRREVLRALLNTFPSARERDCALAIELAMQDMP